MKPTWCTRLVCGPLALYTVPTVALPEDRAGMRWAADADEGGRQPTPQAKSISQKLCSSPGTRPDRGTIYLYLKLGGI